MWFLRTLYQRESLGKIWGIRQMDQWRSILDPNRQPLLTITSFTVKQVRSMPWEHWIRRYTNKFVLCQKSSSTLAISTNHRFILKFTLPLLFYTRRGAQKNWMHWKVSVFLFCFKINPAVWGANLQKKSTIQIKRIENFFAGKFQLVQTNCGLKWTLSILGMFLLQFSSLIVMYLFLLRFSC